MYVKKLAHVKMSLFAFGFKHVSMEKSSDSDDEKHDLIVPNHMPTVEEACCLGLGRIECTSVINTVGEVSYPIPRKKTKGSVRKICCIVRARIGNMP